MASLGPDASRAEVAAWLRAAREARALSQADAAAEIGIATKTVNNWENARGAPAGASNLLRYLVALGVRFEPAPPIKHESSLREEVAEANRKLDVLSAYLGVRTDDAQTPQPPELDDSGLHELLAAVRMMLRHLEGLAGPDAARWLDGQVAPEPAQLQER